jgi:hypothetical protein
MNWERRLREMILAGGALVAAACSSNGASGRAQDSPDANEKLSQGGCNACSDPCSITSPDGGAIDLACGVMACMNGGGSFVDGLCMNPPEPPPVPLVPEAGSPDAETSDGAPVDAAPVDAEAGPADASAG